MDVVQPPTRSNSSAGSGTVAGDDAEALRIYQAWEGSNVFLLNGRFIFGPDARSIFLTIFLIAAPVAVFCVFVARKLRNHFSHHLGILVMAVVIALTIYVLVVLLMTSGRDPGIIPRSLHPPEPDTIDQDIEVGTGQTPRLRLPRIKEVVVNGMTVKIKYCDTCKLYRPPRCSHCSICDNCVERFDHHCPWVGQCIGRRNYRFFFMFVSSATVLCVYVFAFCWVYVVKIMNSENTSIWKALAKTPASIVLIAYTFIAVWFVGGLTVFHLYLIGTNQSTYENFRYRYDRQANPYNKGIMENFKEIFWTSIPPSKNRFRAMAPRESEIKPRVGGGRLVSPNIEKTMSDLEMSRKPTSNEAKIGINDAEGQHRVSDQYGEVSPNTGTEGRFVSQSMRSSWGRRSGSWEIPSEVVAIASGLGNSNQSNNSSGNLAVGSHSNRQ